MIKDYLTEECKIKKRVFYFDYFQPIIDWEYCHYMYKREEENVNYKIGEEIEIVGNKYLIMDIKEKHTPEFLEKFNKRLSTTTHPGYYSWIWDRMDKEPKKIVEDDILILVFRK